MPIERVVRKGDLHDPSLGEADRAMFRRNKIASGRLKDLADLEALGESGTDS